MAVWVEKIPEPAVTMREEIGKRLQEWEHVNLSFNTHTPHIHVTGWPMFVLRACSQHRDQAVGSQSGLAIVSRWDRLTIV